MAGLMGSLFERIPAGGLFDKSARLIADALVRSMLTSGTLIKMQIGNVAIYFCARREHSSASKKFTDSSSQVLR